MHVLNDSLHLAIELMALGDPRRAAAPRAADWATAVGNASPIAPGSRDEVTARCDGTTWHAI